MFSIADLASLAARFATGEGVSPTAIPRIFVFKGSHGYNSVPMIYEPSFCIVAQGRKRVMVADGEFLYDEAKYLVTRVDVPIISQCIDATPKRPFLSVVMKLDPGAIASVMLEAGMQHGSSEAPGQALVVSIVTSELVDAAVRMLRLLDSPGDIPALAPLIEREILYRLLQGEHSLKLGQVAFADSKLQQVNRAIAWIKQNYREPFSIAAAAAAAGMSSSALHLHFKAVTRLTPLQYQKQLRLREARRLLLTDSLDAAATAFAVGYVSPSQFSREYRRLFGAAPAADGRRLRAPGETESV